MEYELREHINDTGNNSDINEVPVVNDNISYHEFFTNFMLPNVPCIIKNITKEWESYKFWTQDNKPNLEYLRDHYGSCDVTLYDCKEKYFNSHKTETVKFDDFANKWNDPTNDLKYLKDWHLKNTIKDDNFYKVPIYFASDWLNEFLVDKDLDDYRFVYMGKKGTWTPFHADVFNSYSWSANVCGRKRWILFPPGCEKAFLDSFNNLPFEIGDIYKKTRYFELIQETGEAIFVPSGWYHQVWNLEDTISINHNWINGCNIQQMWYSIEDNLNKVKREIDDCKEMENFLQHCQVMLKASYGMDFFEFFEFLAFIATRRMSRLEDKSQDIQFHGYCVGENHAKFDLQAVDKVLKQFVNHEDVKELFSDSQVELFVTKIDQFESFLLKNL